MVEDLAAPAPQSPSCCAAPDAASAGRCVLCAKAVCGRCRSLVNAKTTCAPCRDAVLAEAAKENEAPPAALLGRSIGAALAAAVGCGIAWAALSAAAGIESGFAAVGVGWAVAQAVRRSAGGRRGESLKRVAAVFALFGILLGKYLAIVHVIVTRVAPKAGVTDAGYFDPRTVQFGLRVLPKTLSLYDLLWIFIAFVTIKKILSPVKLAVANARGNAAPAA